MKTIKVQVYKRHNRKHWTARWVDPLTGRQHTRSTKETTHRAALRVALELEAELNAGGGGGPLPWSEFRLAYFREKVALLRQRSKEDIRGTFNLVEDLLQPAWANFTSRDVGRFATRLRDPYLGQDGEKLLTRTDATIRKHLVNLQTALRWAHRQKLVSLLPDFNLPPKTSAPKGRAITAEEFERMLDATPDVVGAAAADSWIWLLRGLYWSGLRLGEAMKLTWDDRGTGMQVDLEGRRPMLLISARAEKGKRDRVLPMAPEFAQLLQAVPDRQRRGHVFRPLHRDGRDPGKRRDWVGKLLGEIGAAAGVVTRTDEDGTQHTATAHDLRRAFGTRWAQRVLPQFLQELMRHKDIKTTQKFYVAQNSQATADAAWQAWERDQEKHAPKPETEKDPR